MARDLPDPVGIVDTYLAAIHDRLGEILDRLPPPAPERPDGTVELTEPKRPTPARAAGRGGGKRASAGAGAPRPTRSKTE